MRERNVRRRVSFWWPQLVPAQAFMMRRRDEARSAMDVTCGVNVRCVSRMTPRMRARRLRGMRVFR
jgi:hypothetical protein